jgi:hypothetical protein
MSDEDSDVDDAEQPDSSITPHLQAAMTAGSYESYGNPFVEYAIAQGWTGEKYKIAISKDKPLQTAQFLAQHGVFPVCSSDNVSKYLKDEFISNGRRRGKGIVTIAMARQFMKAVSNLRTRELSKQIPQLQSEAWLLTHAEFGQRGKGVLRTQEIENLLTAIQRREEHWKLVKCVDSKRQRHRLFGNEQLKLAVWAWRHGTPEHYRILVCFNLGRCCGLRGGNFAAMRLRHMKVCSLGSHASNLSQYPALGFKASEIFENKEGRTDIVGAMIHNNPYLCPVAAVGGLLVSEFSPFMWGRIFPDLSKRELWWNMHLLCTRAKLNSRSPICNKTLAADIKKGITEDVGYTDELYAKLFPGRPTHILRHICAAETSFGGAPASEGNRAGLWADRSATRRDQDYLNEDLSFLVSRASAGTTGPDVRTLHVTRHVPGSCVSPPALPSATSDSGYVVTSFFSQSCLTSVASVALAEQQRHCVSTWMFPTNMLVNLSLSY